MDEKSNENREWKSIIETYDGDPDEPVFFQTAQDFEERRKQKQAEAIWGDTAVEEKMDFAKAEADGREKFAAGRESGEEGVKPAEAAEPAEQVQDVIIQPDLLRKQECLEPTAEKIQTDSTASVGTIPVNTGINPEDPHYAYYEPDPYYEYGYGSEPEPVGMSENGKDDGSGLGMTSMITGICSLVLGCCGLTYLLSLLSIITGICCLSRKQKSGSAKTFSIIGIICGALALLAKISTIVLAYGMSFLTYFIAVCLR